MAKLRNGGTDVERFVQWMGRKCRNHHPLEELQLEQNTRPGANTYKAKSRGEVSVLRSERSAMLYRAGGRVFKMSVEEVGADEVGAFDPALEEAVGY